MLRPHPCTEFLNQFLVKRKLTRVTGKSLYTYKTSRAEYETLKTLLTQAPPAESTSACFVLYAAEWWRRNYSGGHWEWEPIFTEINRPGWGLPSQRAQLMNAGCSYWGRQIFQHESGKSAFLGTLFSEAGLPIQLLTSEGYIRALIIKSFTFLQTYRTHTTDTVACIRDLARTTQLPGSLNVDAFYKLIYQVINVLLSLKNTHRLGEQPEPLSYLNEHVPAWRDELPLRIDDAPNARAFLDSLLVDVAKIMKQEVSRISLSYTLHPSDTTWKLKTTLQIPDGFHSAQNLQFNEEEYAALSGKIVLKIVSDGQEQLVGHGFKASNSQLSIKGLSNCVLPANSYTIPWALVFADSHTEQQIRVELPYADGLDARLPWVFTGPDNDSPVLKGVGSVRLSASRAFVVCPADFILDAPEGTALHRGYFADGQTVYALTATCVLRDLQENQEFRIRLAEPTDDNYFIALHPQSNSNYLKFCQKQNAGIFLGFPRILKLHKLGGVTLADRGSIQYKSNLNTTWQTIRDKSDLIGRFKIRSVGAEGEVLFCREITVLPANFGVRFDIANQQILLEHTDPFTLSVQQEAMNADPDIQREGTGHRIRVKAGSQGDTLKLRLMTATTRDVTLYVPFPAASGHFTDREGHIMTNNQPVDLQNLHGVHLALSNVSSHQQTNQLSFTLLDIHNREAGLYTLTKTIDVPSFSYLDVSLMKYRHDIERLLSFTNTVDAVVRVQYSGGTSICVSQYTHQTSYNHQTGLVTLGGNTPVDASVQLRAFPLSEPFAAHNLIDLECREDGWQFPDAALVGGKWFYFSTDESAVSVRPSVAKRASQIDETTEQNVAELHEATNHTYENRLAVLTALYDHIGIDFTDVNWTTLQRLYDHTQHLPLNALDVWKALTRSNQGLVAFFLQFDSIAIGKLSRAFSANWRSIPVAAWLDGFRALRASLPDVVADLVVNQKIEELDAGFSLGSLAQIVQTVLMNGVAGPDFLMCQYPACIQPVITNELMGTQGQMGLIQKHDGHPFPTYLKQELVGSFNQLPNSVRALLAAIPPNFHYVRPVAYLPVLLAYQSVYPDALNLSGLNQLQVTQLIDFDEEFFNLIYNLIQAHCWLTFIPNPVQHGN